MTGADALAETRVRPLKFGDEVLIQAIRVVAMVEDLFTPERGYLCPACLRSYWWMSEELLLAHHRARKCPDSPAARAAKRARGEKRRKWK